MVGDGYNSLSPTHLTPLLHFLLMYISPAAEHNLYTDDPNVFNVGAGATQVVLPSEQNKNTGEIAQRIVQNCSANSIYYSENMTDANGAGMCDATVNFHGIIPAGAQLDCSGHRQVVTVYCPAAAVVSTTIRRRGNA